MGRLADLAASRGRTLPALASLLGCRPLLLVRVDQGRQALPRSLRLAAASLLGVEDWEVVVACRVVTDLDDEVLFQPIPLRPGERLPGVEVLPDGL